MVSYKIIANPGHNRVYFNESFNLSVKELNFAKSHFDTEINDVRVETFGVPYISFESVGKLSEADLKRLGEMSFTYAVFQSVSDLLKPIETTPPNYMRGDINTILKYGGKTNELFTRLMVNMALYASNFSDHERVTLLDPLCGKGTTLFEGLMRGYDVIGVELLPNPVHEAEVFLIRYLKENRYIHRVSHEKRTDEKGKKIADCVKIRLARTRDEFAKETHCLTMFAADARIAHGLIKKSSVHIIAADLPYGVQHGSGGQRFTRDPVQLLTDSLPGFIKLLKPGGAMAFAYNVNVTPREKIQALLESFGLCVSGDDMIHRVDQSILRDIIVAVK